MKSFIPIIRRVKLCLKRAFVICIQQLRSNRRLAHDSASQLIKIVYSLSD